jgi:hypothetical protein
MPLHFFLTKEILNSKAVTKGKANQKRGVQYTAVLIACSDCWVGVAATTWLPAMSSDAVVLLLSSGSGYETLPGGPSAKALYF